MKQNKFIINPVKGEAFRETIFREILKTVKGKSLVDLGAGHCRYSVIANKMQFDVTAVDARTVRVPADLPFEIKFIRANVLDFDVSSFDVVCILGLLYHLNVDEQIKLLKNCKGKLTIIDTHLTKNGNVTEKGYAGSYYNEASNKEALIKNPKASFTTLKSFWHTYESFYGLMKEVGYKEVTTITPEHFPERTFFICNP